MATRTKAATTTAKKAGKAASEARSNPYVQRFIEDPELRDNVREAFDAIKSVCEEHLADRYDLEVVDIYQQPALAKHEQVIAAPTLVKKQPLPLRRLIGDLADKERLLFGLDLSRKI